MAKRPTIIKNWPKYLLQWGVLVAFIAYLAGFLPEIPTGKVHDDTLHIFKITAVIAAVVFGSRLFCGYLCPAGTVQDLLSKAREAIRMKGIKVRNGSLADKILRMLKYVLLFWILYLAEKYAGIPETPAAVLKGDIMLWISAAITGVIILGSFFIDMFFCRYLCPLGAIFNSFRFRVWVGVLLVICYAAGLGGADIPWNVMTGIFCLAGYILEIFHGKPKTLLLNVVKDNVSCNNCGTCIKNCPQHIDMRDFHNGVINHVDCTLCGECIASCSKRALNIGVNKPTQNKITRFIPPLLAACLIALAIWASGILL